MRKILYLIVWISSLSILLLSCSKDETEDNKKPNDDDNNMVTVSLGLTGDILEVEETPLSKAIETADIYGVQIYSSPKDEDNYQPYGSGIFIDKSKMQIKLFKDRKYKFEMTVFPDGGYEVNTDGIKCAKTGIRPPFNTYYITDSIGYEEYELGQLSESSVGIEGDDGYYKWNRPAIDRYYGKLIDYIPTENSTVNIDLKRVVSGLTFKITNTSKESNVTFFTSLKVDVGDETILDVSSQEMIVRANTLIALQGENGYYTDKWFENPIDELTLKLTLTSQTSSPTNQSNQRESFTQTVTLKRKMNYTFQITIPETFLVRNGINVTEEDAVWDDDVTVDNIYFGDLTIENEEDLRAFKEANYTKVTGNLIFKHWNKDICTGSNTLYSIGGDLKFIASSSDDGFTFVDGLSFNKLSEIGGSFEFISEADRQFWGMNDFTGFSNLKSIGSDFKIISYVASFINFSDLRGLTNLEKIGGNVEINGDNDMREFQSMAGLNETAKISGDIKLTNLSVLKSYCDLKTVLQNHTGQFIVSGNAYNPTKEQILAGECSIE